MFIGMKSHTQIWLEKHEKAILAKLQSSINKALHLIGDDIKGIDWFCSKAEQKIAKKYQKVA